MLRLISKAMQFLMPKGTRELRGHKDDVSIQEIFDDVRHQLSDNGVRITDGLLSFERAWWPNEPDFQTQLLSDRGVLPGPKEVVDEFYAEVLAIQKTIERFEHGQCRGG
jgi:hypothetical protein